MRRRRRSRSSTGDEIRFDSKASATELGGEILEGTNSDLASFGETGTTGFADAWTEADAVAAQDDEFSFGADSSRDKSRDLDRRSRRGLIIIALIVVAGAGLAWASSQGYFDDSPAALDEASRSEQLLSPSEPRTYASAPRTIQIDPTSPIDSMFRAATNSDEPEPLGSEDPRGIRFGPVLWGGRTHVVVLSETSIDFDVECLVVSLVTNDLRVLDLAAEGRCDATFAETGDRLACSGSQVVMLEVWSTDPSSSEQKPAAEWIRARVETRNPDGSIVSTRGVLAVPPTDDGNELAEASVPLGGQPGSDVVIAQGEQQGLCTLIDRDDVIVQLLPG